MGESLCLKKRAKAHLRQRWILGAQTLNGRTDFYADYLAYGIVVILEKFHLRCKLNFTEFFCDVNIRTLNQKPRDQ